MVSLSKIEKTLEFKKQLQRDLNLYFSKWISGARTHNLSILSLFLY